MKNFTLLTITFLISVLFAFQSGKTNKFQKKTGFEFIPSGNIALHEQNKSIAAFMMLNHEVTNAEYRLFIQEAYLDKGDVAGAKAMMPDTMAWIDTNYFKGFTKPFANLYYSHPAYDNYPVVNVSKENAERYCAWLDKKIAAEFPELEINNIRLPTQAEWTYAAKGGLKSSPYPWGGPYTRNAKGQYLANFYVIGEHNIAKGANGNPIVVDKEKYRVGLDELNGDYFSLCNTKSYVPNGFGLYNMAGNAAEMIAEKDIAMGGHWMSFGNDIQVTSQIEFLKGNPFVGFRPVYSYLNQTKN